MAVTRELAQKETEEVITTFAPLEIILENRAKTHGDFGSHAAITQAIKADMSCQSSYSSLHEHQRESLEMIAHKIGRILAGDPDFRDHWDDIAGYAKLSADRCTK